MNKRFSIVSSPFRSPILNIFLCHTRRWSRWHSSQSQVVSPCNIFSCRRLRIRVPQIFCFLFSLNNWIICCVLFAIELKLGREERKKTWAGDKYGREKINKFGLSRVYTTFVACFIGHSPWELIWSSGDRSPPGLPSISLSCCYREILSCKREINSRFPLYFLLLRAVLSFVSQTAEAKKAEKDFANKLKCFGHKEWENENGKLSVRA